MATETLNPNADGTTNEYSLSTGSSRFALVNDGSDATYVSNNDNTVEVAHWWAIRIDGTTIYDADIEPGAAGEMMDETDPTNFTREINSDNFSGCPTLTKALITSLEIGMKSGGDAGEEATQLFNLDNPTFPDSATINSATIHGRLSGDTIAIIFEISLVVDYTAVVSGYGNDVIGIDSGDISTVNGIPTANIGKVNGV